MYLPRFCLKIAKSYNYNIIPEIRELERGKHILASLKEYFDHASLIQEELNNQESDIVNITSSILQNYKERGNRCKILDRNLSSNCRQGSD